MHLIFLISGILVFLFTVSDLVKTTFSATGGGYITNNIARLLWICLYKLAGGNGRSVILRYAGSFVLMMVILVWLSGFWFGFFLLLLSDQHSVVYSVTLAPASSLDKLYYAGSTLSTLGLGDLQAGNEAWRVISSIGAFSGLACITASITYFVPVLNAVELQSQLSLFIRSMGQTPQQLLVNSWNGRSFSSFFDTVPDLCRLLIQHIMNHHSYPVLHYFHHNNPKLAVIPAITLLHETYLLLSLTSSGLKPKDQLKMTMLGETLNQYLQTMQESYIPKNIAGKPAPLPDLNYLHKNGMPEIAKTALEKHFAGPQNEQRKLFSSLLENDGWSWNEVYGEKPEVNY